MSSVPDPAPARPAIRLTRCDPEAAPARTALRCYYDDLDRLFPEGFRVEVSLDPDREALRPPRGGFFVALGEGETVLGCVALKGAGGGIGEVKRLWVADEARGRGLARALMAAAEDEARALGMERLRLDTHAALAPAIALYRASGWREVPAFNAEPYAHHWFEKAL